jgi:hypothetical protein
MKSLRKSPPRAAALIVLLSLAGFFLVQALARVAYPYDLDVTEESLLLQALRMAQHLPVYGPPSAEFAAQQYMPLYTWLGGLLLRVAPAGFAPLRLLSLAATLTAAVLIGWIARRESGQAAVGLASGGLYLAGYRIAGGWYDLARVDSLFVALTLGGLAAAIYGRRLWTWRLLAALLLALATLTKQQGLVFALLVAGYLGLSAGRQAWWFVLAYLGAVLAPLAALQAASDGAFLATMGLAFASPLALERLALPAGGDLLGGMAGLLPLGAAAALLAVRRAGWRAALDYPWLLFLAAALGISLAGRLSVGGDRNNWMPAYAMLCLTPGLLAGLWRDQPALRRPALALTLLWLALLLQAGLTLVNPIYALTGYQRHDRFWPVAADRAAGERFVQRLAASDGPVWVMMHPWYAMLAGQEASVQVLPLWHARRRGQDPLPPDLVQRIASQYYAAIVSDESAYFESDPVLLALIEAYYQPVERLAAEDAPATLNGFLVRPQVVYVPHEQD